MNNNMNNVMMGNVAAASAARRPENIRGSPENPHPKFTWKKV